jgi:hypothetical protein
MRPALDTSHDARRILAGRSAIALAAAAMALALTGAGCGSGSSDAPASSAPAASAGLTTDTPCSEWLAASADAKASALESDAAYNEGGINAWIAESRRTLAATPQEAATVPATVSVDAGVALVDKACALVAPDDTVASAIPAYDYQAAHGGATTP